MERFHHDTASFITLTYEDRHLPENLCVTKREAQLFLKKLRKQIAPRQIRYFMVGEYGDKSQRPHYHAIIFGLDPTEGEVVKKCWQKGFIQMGTAETKAMSYCGSYVVKKWTKRGHPDLEGRDPEFSLKSQGIGKNFAQRVIQAYKSESGAHLLAKERSIQTSYAYGSKHWPMGRYVKEKIYEGLAFTKEERRAINQKRNDEVAALAWPLTTEENIIREENLRIKDEQQIKRKTHRSL